MFGEPLMTDESQLRWPTAFVRPPNPLREDTEDSNADANPHDVHRQVSLLFLFATIREYWIRGGEDVRNGTVAFRRPC
jgi:hypothetical protein